MEKNIFVTPGSEYFGVTIGGIDDNPLNIENIYENIESKPFTLTEIYADSRPINFTIDQIYVISPIIGRGEKTVSFAPIISSVSGGKECAFYLGDIAVCSSPETQQQLRELLTEKTNKPDDPDMPIEKVYEELLDIYSCKSESELLNQPDVIAKIGRHKAREEKETRFKPHGPKDHTWFSNINIDAVLDQWRLTYPQFYNFPFHMINFAELGKPLHRISAREIYDKGYNCYGCVMNTDRYSGSGEHWMALFVDMRQCPTGKCRTNPKIIAGDSVTIHDLRNVGLESIGANDKVGIGGDIVGAGEGKKILQTATVEFFNSSGNKPAKEIREWMASTVENLKTFCDNVEQKVNRIQHQKSDTECGPYSMYYIRMRLEGKSADELISARIPDSVVFKFRDELFRNKE